MAFLSTIGSILRVFLSQDLLQFIKIIVETTGYLRRFHQPPGIYEVLDYSARLELNDTKGTKATYFKEQQVRFLQNHIVTYQDQAWGDGTIFADYKCSPGVVVDRYPQGNVWRILISLRETKNKGDIETFYIERGIEDGFTKPIEYFQTRIDHPTRSLTMSVVFPTGRPPKRILLIEQRTSHTVELNSKEVEILPSGQRMAVWSMKYPKVGEGYNLQWEW